MIAASGLPRSLGAAPPRRSRAVLRSLIGLRCVRCAEAYPVEAFRAGCARCLEAGVAANLTVRYSIEDDALRGALQPRDLPTTPRSMWRWDALLHARHADAVTLGEGATPLVAAPALGLGALWFKDETRNPSWSFKDRLASGAITMARELGARVIASSSSGNAGAAAAAYAARAGLPCVVFTYQGAAGPPVRQMQACGAHLVRVPAPADRWRLMSAAVAAFDWYPASVYFGPAVGSNPFGVEAYKTIAYEIAEALDWRAPDWCALPVCYGDALYGMWKGFAELVALGWTDRVPRFVAAEVSGSLADAMASGLDRAPVRARAQPSIAASIGASQGTGQALAALRASNGLARYVDDAAIRAWNARLARETGLYAEMSAAATLPAIEALRADGTIGEDDVVVAVLTAAGLKDAGDDASMPPPPLVRGGVSELVDALKESYGFDPER